MVRGAWGAGVVVVVACNASPPLVAPAPASSKSAQVVVIPEAPAAPPCVPHVWPTLSLSTPAREGPDAAEERLAKADAGLRAACKRIEAASKRHMIALYPSGPGPFGTERQEAIKASKQMGCSAGARGAWAVEIGAFRREPTGMMAAPYTVEYVAPGGTVRPLSKDALGDAGPNVLLEAPGDTDSDVAIADAFDFDGDGIDEVLVGQGGYASIDGFYRSLAKAYRLVGDRVTPWEPVPGREIVEWRDVDGDGRPDVVLSTGTDVSELAHALPSGAFSTDDEITRAFVHAECTRPKPPPSANLSVLLLQPPAPLHGPRADALCAPTLRIDAQCPAKAQPGDAATPGPKP